MSSVKLGDSSCCSPSKEKVEGKWLPILKTAIKVAAAAALILFVGAIGTLVLIHFNMIHPLGPLYTFGSSLVMGIAALILIAIRNSCAKKHAISLDSPPKSPSPSKEHSAEESSTSSE